MCEKVIVPMIAPRSSNYLNIMNLSKIVLISLSLSTGLLWSKPLKVHIMSGQSNMSGYGGFKDGVYKANPSLDQKIPFFYHVDTKFGSRATGGKSDGVETLDVYRILDDGTHQYKSHTKEKHGRWGAELSYARTLTQKTNERHGIIKIAEGGTNLVSQWNPSKPGPCWEIWKEQTAKALAELTNQGYKIEIASIVWTQGEGDTNSERAAFSYEKNLRHLVESMFSHLDSLGYETTNTFFINNSFSHSQRATMKHQEEVRRAQAAVMKDLKNGIYYDNSALCEPEHYLDAVHYNGSSLYVMGVGLAQAYLRASE